MSICFILIDWDLKFVKENKLTIYVKWIQLGSWGGEFVKPRTDSGGREREGVFISSLIAAA